MCEVASSGLHSLLHPRDVLAVGRGSRRIELNVVAHALPLVGARLHLHLLSFSLRLHFKVVGPALHNLFLSLSLPLVYLVEPILLPLLLLLRLICLILV